MHHKTFRGGPAHYQQFPARIFASSNAAIAKALAVGKIDGLGKRCAAIRVGENVAATPGFNARTTQYNRKFVAGFIRRDRDGVILYGAHPAVASLLQIGGYCAVPVPGSYFHAVWMLALSEKRVSVYSSNSIFLSSTPVSIMRSRTRSKSALRGASWL